MEPKQERREDEELALPREVAPDVEEQAGSEDLRKVIERLRDAVAAKMEPDPHDMAVAQQELGNARVAEILRGEDMVSPEQSEEAHTDFKLYVYARGRQGEFDAGRAYIRLVGEGGDQVFSFGAAEEGAAAFDPKGTRGAVRGGAEIGLSDHTMEVELTQEQYAAALLQATAIAEARPDYNLFGWNTVDFVRAVAGAAAVAVPSEAFEGILNPKEEAEEAEEKAAEPVVEEDDDADDDDGADAKTDAKTDQKAASTQVSMDTDMARKKKQPPKKGEAPPPDSEKDDEEDKEP